MGVARDVRPVPLYPANFTNLPAGAPSTSSSRITALPRIMVATGQPVMSIPAKGVQPQGETIQLSSIFRRAFMSTMVKSAS